MQLSLRTTVLALTGIPLASAAVQAVEIHGMRDFPALHGRYAPHGDCRRGPRFEIDASGIRFDVDGKREPVTTLEHAASYGGDFYEGTSLWFFPFGRDGSYPVLMTFNADEKPGVVTIEPHGEGGNGGPALSPRNRALVEGSPYARCR